MLLPAIPVNVVGEGRGSLIGDLFEFGLLRHLGRFKLFISFVVSYVAVESIPLSDSNATENRYISAPKIGEVIYSCPQFAVPLGGKKVS